MKTTLPGMAEAYDLAAAAWAKGPSRLYGRLADELLDAAPVALAGASVLDVGAGTGVVAAAVRTRGAARVVAADLAAGMLAQAGPGVGLVVADAARLPFTEEAFDLLTAGSVINHVPTPSVVLAEFRRVATALVATTFAPADPHPAKAAVDQVASNHGWRPPTWYLRLKQDVAPETEDVDRVATLAAEAGYGDVHVDVRSVSTGIQAPTDLAEWRLGMAHLAPFLASLTPAERDVVIAEAIAAVDAMPPLTVDLVILSAR